MTCCLNNINDTICSRHLLAAVTLRRNARIQYASDLFLFTFTSLKTKPTICENIWREGYFEIILCVCEDVKEKSVHCLYAVWDASLSVLSFASSFAWMFKLARYRNTFAVNPRITRMPNCGAWSVRSRINYDPFKPY